MMTVPEEAVERARKRWHEAHCGVGFECVPSDHCAGEADRETMRAALEAAALPYLAPAGDGGLREALEKLVQEWRYTDADLKPWQEGGGPDPYESAMDQCATELKRVLDVPAAPAVPQPVDRDALSAAVYEKSAAVVLEGGYIATLIAPEDAVAAVLAVLAGEQARG